MMDDSKNDIWNSWGRKIKIGQQDERTKGTLWQNSTVPSSPQQFVRRIRRWVWPERYYGRRAKRYISNAPTAGLIGDRQLCNKAGMPFFRSTYKK